MGYKSFFGGLRAPQGMAGNGQLRLLTGLWMRTGQGLKTASIVPALLAMAISLVASPVAAQPTLTTSPNPSIHNQSVRLQAVISGATAPTGTMTFRETGVGAPLGMVAVATARYTKVVAGGNNMCGIVSDTTLECWGFNAVGQLGDGTISPEATTPVQVPGLIGVTNVEIGSDHVCAVMADKTVKCWGNNVYGQVGNTTGGQILSPVTVTGLTDVTAVALGTSFSCALKSDGTVACWGRNYLGQLGIGNLTDTNTPTAISGLTNITAITAGQDSACALKADGTVSCWGSNQFRQVGDGNSSNSSSPRSVLNLSTAVTIDAGGGYQVCALLTDATIQCWGRNDYGQLGTGTATTDEPKGLSTPQTVTGITNATNVTSGNGWSCAALAAGNPKCWGFNFYGGLAQGFNNDIYTAQPTPLDAPAFAGAVYFALGGGGSCAILANDTIRCTGDNDRGQLGNGTKDSPVLTPRNVVKTFTKSVAVITRAFTAGTHTLIADFAPTIGALTTSADVVQTVNKLTQTITFPALADKAFSATPPTPAASASSGLPVSYGSSTQDVCTVSFEGTINFVSVGTCSITASQAGDASRDAATPVTQSFSVTIGSQTITFPALADTAFTATPPVPAATSSSKLAVTYAETTPSVCTATGSGVITFVKTGTCTIRASQAGDTNFAAATAVTQSFAVTPGVNTITFPALANTAFTATPPTLGATASSNLTVSYASSTPACTVAGGVISFVSAGTCTITASQLGSANFAAATAVSRSFAITPGTNTITFPALANTAFTATPPVPAATASSKLAVAYASTTTPVCTATSAGVITFVKAGTCTITASQPGNASFAAATVVSRSFTVLATVTVVTTSSKTPAAYGVPVTFTAKVTVPAGGAATGTVTFKDGGATLGVGTLTNGTATLTTATLAVGTHAITAAYDGSATQGPGVSPALAQVIAKANPVLTLTVTPNPVEAGQPVALAATLAVTPVPATGPSGSIVFRDGATVIGSTTILAGKASFSTSTLAPGGHSLTASYAGDARFAAVTSAAMPLTVQRSCKDAFASAAAFGEATGSASGSTNAATGETGEGRHGGDTGAINSVWCKWTAPAAGRVTIDTTGSTFNTTLAVYTGTAIGQLTKVAANDNIDAATRQSRVAFTAVQGKAYMIAIDGAGAARGAYVLNWTQTPAAPKLYAAVLPASRSIQTGSTATAFATIINSGNATATGCGIALPAGFPAAFSFQTTNAANVSTGTVATAVNIPAGGIQRFVFGVTPTNAMEAAEIPLVFDCANTQPAPSVAGLNRFTLTAAAAPSPDIIAIASTTSNDGIVTIPASGPGLFTAASLNIGAAGTLTVQADDGGNGLPLTLTLCRSDPKTGACAAGSTPKPSLRIAYGASATVTFTVFAKATGTVAFDPALNRIQLRWKTADGITRGITSMAVKTR